jgi:hypothetical protein
MPVRLVDDRGQYLADPYGQRRRGEADPVVSAQVDGYVVYRGGAVCKTVGSAYVVRTQHLPDPDTVVGQVRLRPVEIPSELRKRR